MCSPVRRSVYLIQRASVRIQERKFPEAERLLNAASSSLHSQGGQKVNGVPLSVMFDAVSKQLTESKS